MSAWPLFALAYTCLLVTGAGVYYQYKSLGQGLVVDSHAGVPQSARPGRFGYGGYYSLVENV